MKIIIFKKADFNIKLNKKPFLEGEKEGIKQVINNLFDVVNIFY